MYYVDFCDGEPFVPAETMEEAKEIAENGAAPTRQPILIIHEEENVAALPWYDGPAEEGDLVIHSFGEIGYYGDWAYL